MTSHLDVPLLESDANRFELAAVLVNDALHGRSLGYKSDVASLFWYRLFHRSSYRALVTFVAALHMSLVLFEAPFAGSDSTSSIPLLGVHIVESLVFTTYLVDIYIHQSFLPRAALWSEGALFLKGAAIVLFAVDIFTTLTGTITIQFSRPIRPFFFIAKRRHVRDMFHAIVTSVPRLAFVFSLVLFQVIVFTVLGYLSFRPEQFGTEHLRTGNATLPGGICSVYDTECTGYFDSLAGSLYHCWSMLTRVNFPDVMLPYAAEAPASAVFFVAFSILSNFFLLRIVLAVAYSAYKSFVRQVFVYKLRNAHVALRTAFALVGRGGPVSHAQYKDLLSHLGCHFDENIAYLLFRTADVSGTGSLNEAEFGALAALLDVRAKRRPTRAIDIESWPAWRQALRRGALSPWLELAVDSLIILSVLLFLSAQNVTRFEETQSGEAWARRVITLLFTGEQLVKIAGLGWTAFCKSWFNIIDLAAVGASVTVEIVVKTAFFGTALYRSTRLVVLVRLVRFVRLFRLLQRYETLMVTLRRVLPLVARVGFVLCATLYAFAIIGMELFGDKLDPTNPRLAGSMYVTHGFSPLSFSDFGAAMLALFDCLLGAKWSVLLEALVVAEKSWFPVLYFVVFYLVAVVVSLNVVIAFLLDAFLNQYSDTRRVKKGQRERWKLMVAATAQRVQEELFPRPPLATSQDSSPTSGDWQELHPLATEATGKASAASASEAVETRRRSMTGNPLASAFRAFRTAMRRRNARQAQSGLDGLGGSPFEVDQSLFQRTSSIFLVLHDNLARGGEEAMHAATRAPGGKLVVYELWRKRSILHLSKAMFGDTLRPEEVTGAADPAPEQVPSSPPPGLNVTERLEWYEAHYPVAARLATTDGVTSDTARPSVWGGGFLNRQGSQSDALEQGMGPL